MSVDFEFRNKDNPLSYDGTPSYEKVKKVFESGKIRGTKVVPLPKENRMYPTDAFSVDCGGGCWLAIFNTGTPPTIKMSHFDHVERAMQVTKQAAKLLNCTVLNDLEDSPYWSQKTYEKSKTPERSKFGISESSIKNVFGLSRSKKKSTSPKRKVCRCKS
jgi:hypothetical protein